MRPVYRLLIAFLWTILLFLQQLPIRLVSASASIPITVLGLPYTQNFDSLSNSIESAEMPDGWTLLESGTSANGTYMPGIGDKNTPDTYSFGSKDDNDRALGGVQGSDLVPLFGASFSNETGKVIDTLEISYTGEQWRLGKFNRSDRLIFEISYDAVSLETGTWALCEKLIFITPNTVKVGEKDGNSTSYRTNLNEQITGLDIEPGATFWIRWNDFDAVGYDDGLAVDDFSLTAFGAEESPIVFSINPEDSATGVELNADLAIGFSEPVTLLSDWLEINCSQSGLHSYSVNGSGQDYVIHPEVAFVNDETCTLTVLADRVSDTDTDDPPDGLESNYVSSFSTIAAPDEAPFIASISPANNETDVPLDKEISISFSEAVDLESGWLELNCGYSGTHAVVINGGPQEYVLSPAHGFSYDESCAITINAVHVTDQDSEDPPDSLLMDQSILFSTISAPDTAPVITSTFPVNEETDIPNDSSITITFDEAVSVNENWFDLTCESSGIHNATVSTEGQKIIIDPAIDFEFDERCSLLIFADGISDADTEDPPDLMANNFEISFRTDSQPDLAPFVVETSPADGTMDFPTAGSIIIKFSEPVTLDYHWVNFSCSKSGEHEAYIVGGPTTYTMASQGELAYAEVCTITLFAAEITDQDSIDPPDQMESNYSFSISTQEDPNLLPYPVVVFNSNTYPGDGVVLDGGISWLTLQFSKDVLHDGSEDAADNPQNYRLFSIGQNRIFNTLSCGDIVSDDLGITINNVSFDPTTFIARLDVNDGTPLPDDIYRLIVCGDHTIRDLSGNALNDGANSYITFTIQSFQPSSDSSSSNTGNVDSTKKPTKTPALFIPVTGFSPGQTHLLPFPDINYTELDGLWLDIPAIGIASPITGVPLENGAWDVSWLGDQTGWLDGSAYPTLNGNSVLTGHVWDAKNQPGVFYDVDQLVFGDQVIIHSFGSIYVYEVREVLTVKPESVNAMLKHQSTPWITLVTCQGFDEESGSYQKRVLVRAELVEVK